MNQVVTKGIVLTRTNFGEADRILTILTPDHGKIRVMAKGVRKVKSKLAGGIELFSISNITYIPGKKDIHTLVSTRLDRHFGNLVHDLTRTMSGYDLLKQTNRATEEVSEPEYFTVLAVALQALDDGVSQALVELWFNAQLLKLAGHQPNLTTDTTGTKLEANKLYTFDFDSMSFAQAGQGLLTPAHITFLRLIFGVANPSQLQQVQDAARVLGPCVQLLLSLRAQSANT